MTIRNLGQKCPYCKYLNDGVTGLEGDEPPVAGDCSICLNCSSVCIFESDLSLRKPTDQEMESLEENPLLKRAISHIAELQRFN